MIRHLFSKLIDEIIKRDEQYRGQINTNVKRKKDAQHSNEPISIQIPSSPIRSWQDTQNSAATPRANGAHHTPVTPSMGIGIATPGAPTRLPGLPEDGAPLNKQASQASRPSTERSGDYFSNIPTAPPDTGLKPPVSPGEGHHDERSPTSPSEPDRETNGKDTSIFGKKFRMGMSFGTKKRTTSSNTEKPTLVDEKVDDARSSSSENSDHMRGLNHNLRSIIQRIRNEYDRALLQDPLREVESLVTPSLPNETPVLKIPPATTVILQTEAAGGYADQYRGTVGSVGDDARFIEERAPTWLGELLLRVCSNTSF